MSHAPPHLEPKAPVAPRFDPARPWESVTLAISGFGADASTQRILLDWFEFLGGRPREVVYVDGGSPPRASRILLRLLQDGLIDRLELVSPSHWENHFDRCYIQEYRSGRLASQPYICFAKLDVLPFRNTHGSWLADDLAVLDRQGVFAVTFSHLIDPPVAREGPYLAFDFLSLNYGIIKRDTFHRALEEQIGGFIAGNFRGEYPAHIDCEPRYRRALLEWAWQNYCRDHGLRTLARAESRDWTILHINKKGRKLLEYRRAYRRRESIEQWFDKSKALYRPPLKPWQRAGRALEEAVRRIRRASR